MLFQETLAATLVPCSEYKKKNKPPQTQHWG